MKAEPRLAVVQGWADTARALGAGSATRSGRCSRGRSARSPSRLLLLLADWVDRDADDARPARHRTSPASLRGDVGDFGFVLYRNGLVLALHALACVAGFMAGSSLPQVAEGYSGSGAGSTTRPARWRSAS